jgi:hypothetical protein
MTNAPQEPFATPVHRHGDPPTLQSVDQNLFLAGLLSLAPRAAPFAPTRKLQPSARWSPCRVALAVSLALLGSGVAAAQGNSPTQLRQFIDQQVGGIEKLMVPEHNADLPQPRLPDGSPDPRFQTTEAKRYLGRGGVEVRHAPQLRRGRRGAGLHGPQGELHSTPAASARTPAPAAEPALPR